MVEALSRRNVIVALPRAWCFRYRGDRFSKTNLRRILAPSCADHFQAAIFSACVG